MKQLINKGDIITENNRTYKVLKTYSGYGMGRNDQPQIFGELQELKKDLTPYKKKSFVTELQYNYGKDAPKTFFKIVKK